MTEKIDDVLYEAMIERLVKELTDRLEELKQIPFNESLFDRNYKGVHLDNHAERTAELLGESGAIEFFLSRSTDFDDVFKLKEEILKHIEDFKKDDDENKAYPKSYILKLETITSEFQEN